MRRLLPALLLVAACGGSTPATRPPSNAGSGTATSAEPAPASPDLGRWIERLGGPEHERAVTELEELGDPRAIDPIGRAWVTRNRPARELRVVVSLARPRPGQPESWEAARPYLLTALSSIDEGVASHVDSAVVAADALREARLASTADALAAVAQQPASKKLLTARIAAIRALGAVGTVDAAKSKATAALVAVLDQPAPVHPRTTTAKDERRAAEEQYTLYLASSGAAINALAELRVEAAVTALVLGLYKTPELATQLRRALVAIGPAAKRALVEVLAGKHREVEALLAAKTPAQPRGLGWYCGDVPDPRSCQPVSLRDFYAALVLGDFHDPATAKPLLDALARPAAPAYYLDDQAGPTQHTAVFDALRKLGAPETAGPVRALWADKRADVLTRTLAASAYPFLVRDTTGVKELGAIAADNTADDGLRVAALEAFARLARAEADIALLRTVADRYRKAAANQRKEADARRASAEAADRVLEAEKQKLDDAKARLLQIARDTAKTADEIKAATEVTRRAEDDFKVAKRRHRDATEPFRQANQAAKAYRGFQHMFEAHIARVDVAIRCKDDLDCYVATLAITPAAAVSNVGKHIPDLADWTEDERLGLVEGAIERALLELGKRGGAAARHTERVLELATSDNRTIRQGVLLALPWIAPLPCARCVAKLGEVIRDSEGKTTLGDLTLETQVLRHYFTWAGAKP